MKINDRRHTARQPASSSLVVAKTAGDVTRAKADADAMRALDLGSRLGTIPTDTAQVRDGVIQRMRRSASDISLSGQKPRSLEFWHRKNNNFYDYETDQGLNALRAMCTALYAAHPLIGSAIDIYSKWPLVGAEFRCFAGETRVLTREGARAIADLVGQDVTLLTTGGRWTSEAEVREFGVQRLLKVTLRRNGRTKEVYATPEHRWFVRDTLRGPAVGERNGSAKITWDIVDEIRASYAEGGVSQAALGTIYGISQPMVGSIVRGEAWTDESRQASGTAVSATRHREVETSVLRPGDALVSVYAPRRRDLAVSPYGVMHGFVWGDGSLDSEGGSVAYFHGEKDAAVLPFFGVGRTYTYGDRTHIDGLPAAFKSIPALTEGASYLYGWLAGYFAADGTVSRDGKGVYLDSADADSIQAVRDICTRLGIGTYQPYEVRRDVTLPSGTVLRDHLMHRLPIFGADLDEGFFLIPEHRDRWSARTEVTRQRGDWIVEAVEETDRVETVYCAVVPGTEAFALEDNILTGNCKDEKLVEFYSDLFFDDLDYEEFLVDIGREYWTVGEALPLGTWSETLGVWQSDELVPPEDVSITRTPFSREPFMEMALPETIRRIITTRQPAHEYQALIRNYPDLTQYATRNQRIPVSGHLLKQIRFKGKTFHERGIPIMTRGIRAVLQEEMLNGAQDSISDRLATPLVLTKIGASASDLGTQNPWIPTRAEIDAFQDLMDAALQADFRMMTTHFGVDVSSVFGRETMPNFDSDFERLGERILQVFGMSKTMLSGASSGQTYAADAMNRDLITQLSSAYQRTLRRFVRDRMLVVAEAQGHYDYETRGGKRYPIMEERLIVDENGNQRIEEQPKLLVPDLYLKPMNLTETAAMEQFFNAAEALGIPISARTRFANWDIDFQEEVEQSREETVRRAIELQETRRATYLALHERGLPIPADLKEDFEPRVSGSTTEQGVAAPMVEGGDPPPPMLGIEPLGANAPEEVEGEVVEEIPGLPTLEDMSSPRSRPRESDEARGTMPKPKRVMAIRNEQGEITSAEVELGGLVGGPTHVGARAHALDEWRKRKAD